ncbi:PAS domain-containing protein [Pyruvatibacter sp.]|uniref:PAS domain-containing protein n=1 Tax=Pyruvatibacter sp. TaxID=1981328 RepID=UPI003265A437
MNIKSTSGFNEIKGLVTRVNHNADGFSPTLLTSDNLSLHTPVLTTIHIQCVFVSNDPSAPYGDIDITFLSEPEHPGAIKLWKYWQSKCANRLIPDRADMNFADVPDIAPNLLIAERVEGTDDFRMRLFGSALTQITGEERTGKLLREFSEPSTKTRARWQTVMEEVARTKHPVFIKAGGSRHQTSHLVFHGLVMPMTNGGDSIEQFLGALFTAYTSDEDL